MRDGESRATRRRRALRRSLFATAAVVAVTFALAGWQLGARLPQVLRWAAREWAGGLRLEVAEAQFASFERLWARDVSVALPGASEPFFVADRIEVDFDWRGLLAARVAAVGIERPRVTWDERSSAPTALALAPAPAPGAGGWSIGRLWVTDGHVQVSAGADEPSISFDVGLDLEEVGSAGEPARREHALAVTDLRVGVGDRPLLLRAASVEATASVAGWEEGRIGEIRVVGPELDLAAEIPGGLGAEPPSADAPTVPTVARLIVEGGRLRVPPQPGLPAITAGFEADLRDVGIAGGAAERTHAVEVTDVRALAAPDAAPMVEIPRVRVEVSAADLLRRGRIGVVRVPQGEVRLGAREREILSVASADAGPSEPGDPPDVALGAAPPSPWRVGLLEIGALAVHVSELGPPVPDLTFGVHTTLDDVPLSAAAAAIADQPQRIELAGLALYSPFDPFKKVVTVGSIFVDFSLGGLLRQEVAQVEMLRPAVRLSEDLFWYMASERDDAAASPSPWTIDRFRAELGSLVLEIGRSRPVGLPITFRTEATDVRLDRLADLEIAAELQVPEESYRFPDYDLTLDRVRGDLHFDYPPGRGAENFVSTLYTSSLTWRGLDLVEGWISLTFDPQGINGTFGGAGYSGYVNGGLTVPYAWSEPWIGWVSASQIDLAGVSGVLANGVVEMSGAVDGSVAITIADRSLAHAAGSLSLPQPGRLELVKLDDFSIPADWPAWQQDLARIAVAALRDFDYDAGAGTLAFADGKGRGTLDLRGPAGRRRLEIRYHSPDAGLR